MLSQNHCCFTTSTREGVGGMCCGSTLSATTRWVTLESSRVTLTAPVNVCVCVWCVCGVCVRVSVCVCVWCVCGVCACECVCVCHFSERHIGHRRYHNMITQANPSTRTQHCMTTGFGPFKLSTRSPLQKGRDHSLPKVCSEDSSSWFGHNLYIVATQMGGWTYGVTLIYK